MMHFARFSRIPYLKVDNWSLPNLDVRENDAMMHLEKVLGWPRKVAALFLLKF